MASCRLRKLLGICCWNRAFGSVSDISALYSTGAEQKGRGEVRSMCDLKIYMYGEIFLLKFSRMAQTNIATCPHPGSDGDNQLQ